MQSLLTFVAELLAGSRCCVKQGRAQGAAVVDLVALRCCGRGRVKKSGILFSVILIVTASPPAQN